MVWCPAAYSSAWPALRMITCGVQLTCTGPSAAFHTSVPGWVWVACMTCLQRRELGCWRTTAGLLRGCSQAATMPVRKCMR